MRPTYEQVRKLFIYDPDDGRVIRKNDRKVYTYTDSQGYIELKVCGFQTRAHRVAYLLQTGEWPPEGMVMDHINGDRQDNSWANLRLLPRAENSHQQNTKYRDPAFKRAGNRELAKAAASVSGENTIKLTLTITMELKLPQVP